MAVSRMDGDMTIDDASASRSSWLHDAIPYLIKAIIMMLALTIVGICSPLFAPIAFPLIFLAYALLATISSMYKEIGRAHV